MASSTRGGEKSQKGVWAGLSLKALGEAILYSSISFAVASVEMSSKFSVKNFSKDQETLQNAADALSDYLKIGAFWALGTTLVLGARYGKEGAFYSVLMNGLILFWVYWSYMKAFRVAAKKYGLHMPVVNIFSFA